MTTTPHTWCPTCEDNCTHHTTICTTCGEQLVHKDDHNSSSNDRNTDVSRNSLGRNDNMNAVNGDAILSMMVSSLSSNLPATNIHDLNSSILPILSNLGAENNGSEWQTPPPEALDPAASTTRLRPVSKSYLKTLRRAQIQHHSSMFYSTKVSIYSCHSDHIHDSSHVDKLLRTIDKATIADFRPYPPYNIDGILQISTPLVGLNRGCNPAPSQKGHNTENEDDVVIYMQRGGGITFVQKALHAQDTYPSSARAVLCSNHVDIWPYVMSDSKGESEKYELKIPIIMIPREDGQFIHSLLSQNNHNIGNQYEVIKVKIEAHRVTEVDCCICCDSFKVGDWMLQLPQCQHRFHESCALFWLEKHNTCPYCRKELPTDNEDYEALRRRENVGENITPTGNNLDNSTGLFG